MNKSSIKKYAIWARRELISRISQKALQYKITEDGIGQDIIADINGVILTDEELEKRKALVQKINEDGFNQVIEEVAYTWFNRFSALRFMEVNGYLSSHVRVFTDEENNFKPQILAEAINLELDGLDMDRVYAFKDENNDDALFKYLVITLCNALSLYLPGMFQMISDYTELLFPDNLLRFGSVIHQMIAMIPEEDWKDAIQIIGWLYQYYNSEKKDEVFAALKKNVKITKENIPAATQLFTPDWIVRYMVENSLGRLWVEGHPDEKLKGIWKYYLDEAPQEPDVEVKLTAIRKVYAALTPRGIKAIDPCAGSGHILAYMFDVLMEIYEAYGFTAREAVRSIVENNIYGLDIDERAAQLAYFAVMMKARQYDSRFLSRKDEEGNPDVPKPHVYAICESNGIDQSTLEYFVNSDEKLKIAMESIMREMYDAREYGSILNITPVDFPALYERFDEVENDINMYRGAVLTKLLPLVQVAEALAQKYEIVCTNPPYMGSSGMSIKVQEYVKKNYPDSKSDLFAVFIEKCGAMIAKNGMQAMITQHAWMFLSSFEKLRKKLMENSTTINMVHLGARAFEEIGGEVVQTTSFILQDCHIPDYKVTYCRLIDPRFQQGKEAMFLAGENRYIAPLENFSKIPGSPVAYWAGEAMIKAFENPSLSKYMDCKSGIMTGSSDYIRQWFEPTILNIKFDCHSHSDMGEYKWFPLNSGGDFRKWYGNNSKVVNLWHNGAEIQANVTNYRLRDSSYYFKKGITWGRITSSQIAFRDVLEGSLFGDAGSIGFVENKRFYILGLLCSKVTTYMLQITNPTLNFQVRDIMGLPLNIGGDDVQQDVESIVKSNIYISQEDWDAFETS